MKRGDTNSQHGVREGGDITANSTDIKKTGISTKLEKRADQVLPGSEGDGGEREGTGAGREMAQTVYAHMNK
jgi:hypothetical protein